MDCQFVISNVPPDNRGRHTYTCDICGFPILSAFGPEKLFRNCTNQDRNGPKWQRRVTNFSKALTRHVAAGSPTASQETIDVRFAICQGCPLFNGKICTHESCGCNANGQRKFLNKLAWADQSCPISKWGPEDGPTG